MSKHWFKQACPDIDSNFTRQAEEYQLRLTKPPGSLGLLEEVAVSYCGWQSTLKPSCEKIQISVFAGDHGVCQQGVSAFPQEVTAQMIFNFVNGGAAISVLAKQLKANFNVINMGITSNIDDAPLLINTPLARGTQDFTKEAAMSAKTLFDAMATGRNQLNNAALDMFIGGDMGIGNTTSASAVYSLLLDLPPETTVGPGTGVDDAGIRRKQRALNDALEVHGGDISSPLDVLRTVGGLEMAGLVGAYIASAQQRTPILVDGFIATAAALLATSINPSSRAWMMFAHQSTEPAHRYALESLQAKPLLDIGMRLGEGSGAAVAVSLIQNALKLHNQMATFSDANVSEST